MIRFAGAIIALALLASTPATAEVLAQCGASKGHAWHFEGGLVSKGDAGWDEDGISDGRIQLIRDGDKLDIIFSHATGSTVSARARGADVILMAADPILVVVVYQDGASATVETYTFNIDGQGRGNVAWTTAKSGGLVDKAAVYRARCGRRYIIESLPPAE